MKKEKDKTVDKIAVLNKLFEQYKGNIQLCSEQEGYPIPTIRSYLRELNNIYETQATIYDLSKSLQERIFKDTEKVKEMKMEVLTKGHECIKRALEILKEKMEKEKYLKNVAETAQIVMEIMKANEGILDPVKQTEATAPVHPIFAQIINKQMNITSNGEENNQPKYKWDN